MSRTSKQSRHRQGITASRIAALVLLFLAGPIFATPAEGQTLASRADSAWTRGDHRLAEQLYRTHLAEQPADATALQRLAILALRRSAFDECDSLLRRLLDLAPHDGDAHITRARLLAARGELDRGRAIVDSILAHHPDDVTAIQALAQFRNWNADRQGAEASWRRALALDPANLDSRLGLARTLRQQGRHAAAREVLNNVSIDSTYADLLDELDWIALALDPRAATMFVYEDDSDGNAIATLVMSAAFRPAPRLEVRSDAYMRDAELTAASTRAHTARGGSVTVWTQVEPGWAFHASGGAATSDAPRAATLESWNVAVSTPARSRVGGAVSFSETPFDVTAVTTANRVSLRELAVDGRWSASRDWLVRAEAGAARFASPASGGDNNRWRAQAEVVRRIDEVFGLALAGRTFGFSKDTNDGYFDPDQYIVAEISGRLHRESRHWVVESELTPGIERITSSGAAAGSLRARAGLTYLLRPGRHVRLNVVYANSGIQQIAETGGGDYRYASVGIGILWRF